MANVRFCYRIFFFVVLFQWFTYFLVLGVFGFMNVIDDLYICNL